MTTVEATRLRLNSVDDYLGPAETRFFGNGYRRAEYDVGDIAVDGAGVRSTVGVRYPVDWSRKAAGDLRPHLSTVDMLVLGVQLCEVHLAAAGLDADARRRAWLRKITLRAGTRPQEELDGLHGAATLRERHTARDEAVSVYDCAIGTMRARCEIVHPRVDEGAAGTFRSIEEAVGEAGGRFYGDGFRRRSHRISDVVVDLDGRRSSARLRIAQDGRVSDGIDGAYQPSVSLIDCFVGNLQLAQVMMYEMDAVKRSDSNTLWMLKTVLESSGPRRPWSGEIATEAAITRKQLLPLRGGVWRSVDIEAKCGGVELRSSFAHELPDYAYDVTGDR
ncbi:avirulence D protein (AvrD) [Herbihabitans rhizosphaerae]|uniref:Avirulence D protein (AvrD) n=1 Tax=Herbihabitans rhizosphaerae TaxID=1872711 RepID=A0A4V2EUG0_9PSEU|nr:AvrD family protein [Herbihabitans rhizosphaerae]RZS44443.1 avirulence D protein (AvrD) [Herbihabitans rhizosphaerae]